MSLVSVAENIGTVLADLGDKLIIGIPRISRQSRVFSSDLPRIQSSRDETTV